jgi:hypothetical protein
MERNTAMSLVEEYLRSVAVLLPKDQRDDIVAELRDIVLTRIEALEAAGREPLGEEAIEGVLREVGHPLVVAARYRGGPQHVVGPTLYPYWMFAVKIAITIQLVVAAAVFLARALSGGQVVRAFGEAVGSAVSGAAILIGVATAAAWFIERQGIHIDYLDHWRVRDLRLLDFAAWDLDALRQRLTLAGRDRRRRNTAARGLGAIASGVVLALWLTGVLRFGLVGDMADLRQLGIEMGPLATEDWRTIGSILLWPFLAYSLMLVARGVVLLTWPRSRRLLGLVDLAIGAGVLATADWLWAYSPLAPNIEVASLTGLALRVQGLIDGGVPVALAPILTLSVIAMALTGVTRTVRGLVELLWPEANAEPVTA